MRRFLVFTPIDSQVKGLMHFLHQDTHNILPKERIEFIKLTGDDTQNSNILQQTWGKRLRLQNTEHLEFN